MGICFPYLGEFQPTKYREKILCWMEMFWTMGIIVLPGKFDFKSGFRLLQCHISVVCDRFFLNATLAFNVTSVLTFFTFLQTEKLFKKKNLTYCYLVITKFYDKNL